jgi:uncharacterized membrane protein YphA (DoxX/SURF4 family)
VLRVMMGLVFAVHGYQKFSSGVGAVVASFAKMGIPAPQVVGPFIAGLELNAYFAATGKRMRTLPLKNHSVQLV